MTKTYKLEIIRPEFTMFDKKTPEHSEVVYEEYKKYKGKIVKFEIKVIGGNL